VAADNTSFIAPREGIAFTPSFLFVLVGGPYFDRLRRSDVSQAFLTGAGAAAIGAIAGSAIPLGRDLSHLWQLAVLALALIWFVALRKLSQLPAMSWRSPR
jgi:chromate transporter